MSEAKRVLFVHNPKTGGASMERLMEKNVPDVSHPYSRHSGLSAMLEKDPGLRDYWIFGFVRNPWDRMVSWWSMIDLARQRADAGDQAQISRFERYEEWRSVRGMDFPTFLDRGPEVYPRFGLNQVGVLYAPDRKPDFVGRFEDLLEGFNVVRERLGLKPLAKMPHLHKGSRGPYQDYYDSVTRARVAELFADDIAEFGYEF